MRSRAKASSLASTEEGRGAPPLGTLGLCAVAVLLLIALVAPATAAAATGYATVGAITAGELEAPARAVVDGTTGNVLVVETAKNRVDVFASGAGAGLLTTFGEGELSAPYGIAIDQSNGDVYVTDSGNELIRRYSTDGSSTPTYSLDADYAGPAAGSGAEEVGSFASAIAIDPTGGDLLVADRGNDRVSRFDSAGAFVSSFDGSDSSDGAFTHLEDVTVSPAGKIFIADGEAATGPSRVLRFSDSGAYEATLRELAANGDAYLAYGAAHDELFVGDARECVFCTVSFHVIDPVTGTTIADVAAPSEQLGGLASEPGSGRLYAVAVRGEFFAPARVVVYARTRPDVALDTPGPLTTSSAHLSGTVDPDGVATAYRFEISKDGGATWLLSPQPDAAAGAGASPVSVETDFTVEPNTEYTARLVASNVEGGRAETPAQTFVTVAAPPQTETLPATGIDETGADLNGTINPFGLQTTYHFEYGPTTAYGSRIPAGTEAVAGQGRVSKSFHRTLAGLSPGTTYHFRLVATNSAGTTEGEDQTFTTQASGSIPHRSYEQVSPVNKQGASIIGRVGFQAAADGNHISYLTKSGEQSSALFPRSFATRQTNDWLGRTNIDPPLNVGDNGFLNHPTLAISDDFTHALVASNRALTPGAIENGANLYRVDLSSGAYDFIGATDATGAFGSFVGVLTNNVFQGGATDLSWMYFHSREPLLPGAPKFALYRWSETDGLEVASVLPDGEPTSAMRGQALALYDMVAADGSRVYFNAFSEGTEKGVYMREGTEPSIPISVSQVPGDPTTTQPGAFLGTNKTGRYAFFTSDVKLTADAPGAGDDLYRYDAASGDLEYLGATAFTFPLEGPDGRLQSDGSYGIGDDGNTVYFYTVGSGGSRGVFTVWRDGVLHAIPDRPELSEERRSSTGRYYVFYRGDHVIWLYDAQTDEFECVSCLPDGTPAPAQLPVAGDVPDTSVSHRYARVVGNDGTVYFDTTVRLLSADVNGTRDVYSWKDGAPTLISPGNEPFTALYADSSADGSDVFFTTDQKLVGRDNDKEPDIYDARVDGGLPAQSPPPPQICLRDDCKATPGAGPELPFGGSEALSGPENVKPGKKKATCGKSKRKVKVKGKVKCVKKHKAGKNRKGGNR